MSNFIPLDDTGHAENAEQRLGEGKR
jgi:hypothetical protein